VAGEAATGGTSGPSQASKKQNLHPPLEIKETPMTAKMRFCEICKRPIEPERAEGLPETRLCVKHSEEIAQYGGEFKTVSATVVTSKASILKRNYGGVTTRKVRNQTGLEHLRDDYQRQQWEQTEQHEE